MIRVFGNALADRFEHVSVGHARQDRFAIGGAMKREAERSKNGCGAGMT
jgi:hypothetical protein